MVQWWKCVQRREFIEVYCTLIGVAKSESTISYQEIAKIMNLGSAGNYMAKEVGEMVGTISLTEHIFQRPLLSAVVVRRDTNEPGKGFFELAESLGVFDSNNQAQTDFWKQELQKVYGVWGIDS